MRKYDYIVYTEKVVRVPLSAELSMAEAREVKRSISKNQHFNGKPVKVYKRSRIDEKKPRNRVMKDFVIMNHHMEFQGYMKFPSVKDADKFISGLIKMTHYDTGDFTAIQLTGSDQKVSKRLITQFKRNLKNLPNDAGAWRKRLLLDLVKALETVPAKYAMLELWRVNHNDNWLIPKEIEHAIRSSKEWKG